MAENPIPKLIEEYGSEAKLGVALGVSQPAIHKAKGRCRVSPQLAQRIEQLTQGRFERWRMRPDIWERPNEAVLPETLGAAA